LTWGTAETAFTTALTLALTTRTTEAAWASLTAGHSTLAAAHHLAEFIHALHEFFLGYLPVAVLIHAGKAPLNFLTGEGGVFFFINTAIAVAIHLFEDLFPSHAARAAGATRAARTTKAATSTFTTFTWRWACWTVALRTVAFWAFSFRRWAIAFGWTAEAAFTAALTLATKASSVAFAASAAGTHLLADLTDFCCVDEAIGVAIDAAESLFQFGGLALDEFFFAYFAVAVGIGFFHELRDAAGTVAPWGTLTFLRMGGDHGCAGKTEAIDECLFGFHSVWYWVWGIATGETHPPSKSCAAV
jgi:hypothetical protein